MSLLGGDGGDHYGTSSANMLAGGQYAAVALAPSTSRPRTGTHSFRMTGTAGGENRVVLKATQSVLGVGMAMYFDALPSDDNSVVVQRIADVSNNNMAYLLLFPNGSLAIKTGNIISGTVVAQSDPAKWSAAEFMHVEARWEPNGASGTCEVRVNNVTVIDAININIGTAGAIGMFAYGITAGSWGGNEMCVDDVFWWNASGSVANDFIGDKKAVRFNVDADQAQSDMTRNTGSTDFGCIADTAPDGDTTYLTGAGGDISDFGMSDLAADMGAIVGVVTYVMWRKTDAGSCQADVGVRSANTGSPPSPATAYGATHSPGTNYGYSTDVFETDPATGAPWLRSAVNAMQLRLRRTA